MNSYNLSRKWFDWCLDNPEKISPSHTALYLYAVECCNRVGWREKFVFSTDKAKFILGIKSYNTYIKILNDLVDWGFIKMIEKSKNQFTSNIIALSNFDIAVDKAFDEAEYIALSNFDKANDKAFDKATDCSIKICESNCESKCQSNDSIIKHIQTNKTDKEDIYTPPLAFKFFDAMLELGGEKQLVSDWIKVRKTKKLTNTETALKAFKRELEKSKKDINFVLRQCVEHSWGGFNADWINNSKGSSEIENNIMANFKRGMV